MPDYKDKNGTPRSPNRNPRKTGQSIEPISNGSGKGMEPIQNPDAKQQRKAKKMLMDQKQLSVLQNNLRVAGLYVNSRHLEMLSPPRGGDSLYTSSVCELTGDDRSKGIAIYQVTKMMYNEEENSFEKLVSVYSALNSYGGIIGLILQSDGKSTRMYLCTNTSGSGETAGTLLESNLKGQFPGCELDKLNATEKTALLESFGMKKAGTSGRTVRSLSMIPSRREDERQHAKEFSAQGYEKFIDAMQGKKYTLVVLSQSVSPDAMDTCLEGLEALYTVFSPYAKETATYGENESDTVNYSISSNINNSISRSISKSFGTSRTSSISEGRSSNSGHGYELFDIHFNSGSGRSFGSASSSGTSSGTGEGKAETEGYGSGETESSGTTNGSNQSLTVNRDNKAVQSLLLKVEEHIKRINLSQTFGMWNSACYVIADDVATATMGTSTLAALFSGDSQAAPRAYYNQWDASCDDERRKILTYIQNMQHPVVDVTMLMKTTEPDGSTVTVPYKTEKITPAMMISGKEIPTIMGLPRKSVPGIVVDSMAEFGRNISVKWQKKARRPIQFGNVYHMGHEERTKTVLDLDTFASHIFICGAPGSGKSNTTYNLMQKLIDNKIPFLVIEPVKGEYKIEFGRLPGVNIFTADESPYRQLQINPFEFNPGIHIREHMDNIVQAISACWPLYGAMPGLLKEAFEQAYIDHGWDLEHSQRLVNRGSRFPVFSDLAKALERIINESPYSAQTKGDYKGALLFRVSSLCNGFEKQIFGRSIGIPESTLFNQNTIIDLSSIRSEETRALVMGILIIKLRNYRKAVASAPNSKLLHVTVLEEAHNILKRCSQEASTDSANIQGTAVASLCACIAEMRSSGEGFMIIDQSPSAVDLAAIKDTAIKICMRLPSKDDCEEMGAALSLNEHQIRELSRLDTGIAAIYHAGWTDTILARMGNVWSSPFQEKTRPALDKGTYTRVQGAVLQLMYQNLKDNLGSNIYDDTRDLLDILCKGISALKPVLPAYKQQEILDEVQIFMLNNRENIMNRDRNRLKISYFEFVIDFLKLDGILKMFTLQTVPKGLIMTPLTAKQGREALQWEQEIRPCISRFLFMPEECDPIGAYKWPINPESAQYFRPIYAGILDRYAKEYKDFRFSNALDYLNSIHHL